MNESVNYKGVCRTAPATPGLLKMKSMKSINTKEPYFPLHIENTEYQQFLGLKIGSNCFFESYFYQAYEI